MKLQWQIDDKDAVRVKELVAGQAGNALIRARQERNLAKAKPAVTKERFWRAMVSMRLTTRQKSGPESHVARFIRLNPFPLTYPTVHQARDAGVLIAKVLRKAGGIGSPTRSRASSPRTWRFSKMACGPTRSPSAIG